MTIAPVVRNGFLIFFCLCLPACTLPGEKRVTAIAAAAPYISDALTQPMQELYDKAQAGSDGRDSLRLGLALAAGRPAPIAVSDRDEADLAKLNARLQLAKQEWLKENPPGSEDEVPWRVQIHQSADESAIIERVERETSAAYWLSEAEAATDLRYIAVPITTRNGTNYSERVQAVPAIDRKVLLTAAACATALREQIGLPAESPPEVIQRLRDLSVHEVVVEAGSPKPGDGHATGPAACGSVETFNRYIALLKTSKPSDAPPHRP